MSHDIAPELFTFLTAPASYGDETGTVDVIETHAACVFLAGDEALKVRKAIRFPYLDYSTPDRRLAASRREIELNRPGAPGLYLGLVAITREAPGRLAFAGDGPAVETAVRMRRFDQSLLLDRMAEAGRLDRDLMKPLAEAVREAHRRAAVHAEVDQAAALRDVHRGNVDALRANDPLFALDTVSRIDAGTRGALDDLARLLGARAAAGCVRRCHGDLHLGNIVLWNGLPTLFDALEFDEELATIDILYDFAFLLMDLVHRDLVPHAATLLNAWLAREDIDAIAGLAALPVLMSIRAAVRAKVAGDRAREIGPGPERRVAEGTARSYLDLADILLEKTTPRLVAVGGLSGTGKSTLAERLAAELPGPTGAVLLRSDVERKAMAGVGDDTPLGPGHYTSEATAAVYRRLRERARAALDAGVCVVVDAVHARPDERDAVAGLAREAGVRFDGLWLEAPPDVLRARVGRRTGDASDADEAVVERQLSYDLGTVGWNVVDASNSRDETLDNARAALGL